MMRLPPPERRSAASLRASVGSTEVTLDQSTSVCRTEARKFLAIQRTTRLALDPGKCQCRMHNRRRRGMRAHSPGSGSGNGDEVA
jgi:hypothetical protein